MGFIPIRPTRGPEAVWTTTRLAIKVRGSNPPSGSILR